MNNSNRDYKNGMEVVLSTEIISIVKTIGSFIKIDIIHNARTINIKKVIKIIIIIKVSSLSIVNTNRYYDIQTDDNSINIIYNKSYHKTNITISMKTLLFQNY